MKTIRILIDDKLSGKTVKNILTGHLDMSSRLITALKTKEGIKVNNESVTVRKILNKGDVLLLTLPEKKSENIVPSPVKIDVVYEDEDILLVNKPYNMPTHPSMGHYENTLANAVMYYYRDENFVFRAVNRLDKDTTGLVLIAKNQYSANNLCRQIKENKIQKTYMAICEGEFSCDSGTVEEPIMREKESVIKRIVSPDGQYARTDYTVLAYENGFSLVRLNPVTGRTHQIRVHMSWLGHPLYSDFIYGKEIEGERTRLHCSALSFINPKNGERCNFNAPLPDDFFIRI